MPELHELDKFAAVLEERMLGICKKLDYLIEAMERSNSEARRDIERIDRDIVSLKVKVYGFSLALPIVMGVIMTIITKYFR